MKMYYAHPMSWYDTIAEQDDLDLIKNAGFEPVNPNTKFFHDMVELSKREQRNVMEVFNAAVKKADAIAIRPFLDGRLGAGVAQELLTAIIWGRPVYLLGKGPAGVERLVANYNPRGLLTGVLTVDETRTRISRKQL